MGTLIQVEKQGVSIPVVVEPKTESFRVVEGNGGFDTQVSIGNVEGYQVVHKFGGGTISTTERTIWDGMDTADYPYKYANTPMTIVSSNALDIGQTIKLYYISLVGTDWVYKKGVAITNGTTEVTIQEADDDFVSVGTDAAIMFPYRVINKGTGQGTGGMVGTLTVANGGTTYAKIINGFNQSLMALFPVASGYSIVVHSIGRSVVGSSKAAVFVYAAIPEGECKQSKRVAGLSSGSEYETFDLPYFFPEKTILDVRGSIDVGTAIANAWFDLHLIENSKL